MKWISAHLISMDIIPDVAGCIHVNEDVYLICYENKKILFEKIDKIASDINSSEEFIYRKKKCKLKYLGIRRLIMVDDYDINDFKIDENPLTAISLSYSEYSVNNINDVKKIAAGDEVFITYNEIEYPENS